MSGFARLGALLGGEPRWRTRRGRALAAFSRHRRPLGALLAGLCVCCVYLAVRPPAGTGRRVIVAARDLPGGRMLRAADLGTVLLPAAAVPSGAIDSAAAGRVLAAPVRRGEPLTDASLLGAGLLTGYPADTVAVPVRIADAGSVRLVGRGDHVDVLAAGAQGADPAGQEGPADPGLPGAARTAAPVALDMPVVAVPRVPDEAEDGALIVIAADSEQAERLASAAVTARLSVTIRAR